MTGRAAVASVNRSSAARSAPNGRLEAAAALSGSQPGITGQGAKACASIRVRSIARVAWPGRPLSASWGRLGVIISAHMLWLATSMSAVISVAVGRPSSPRARIRSGVVSTWVTCPGRRTASRPPWGRGGVEARAARARVGCPRASARPDSFIRR
ncbi:hypothetical protein [Streptomyces sp. ISL-100]|uniref:hypothetical protein n=1 Tax=Streptomyces sp. ISL-100 TaxID=2819173 RepID=UPI002035CFB9|nr:hypothetical protein [Streptomyces sp. ISL-100]